MKKLVSMYQKYMFRPILYKSDTRVSVYIKSGCQTNLRYY